MSDYQLFRDLIPVAEKHGYRIVSMGDAPKRWPMKGRARKAIVLEAKE